MNGLVHCTAYLKNKNGDKQPSNSKENIFYLLAAWEDVKEAGVHEVQNRQDRKASDRAATERSCH